MNRIPMLDLKKQIAPIRKELDAAIGSVIDKTNFILGEEVRDFEQDVERYCRVKYAVGASNGTDAIRLSLAALGIKPGDRVICPAFTYYATAGAIASMGMIPVFADIDPLTYTITPATIESAIKNNRRSKIKALIPVHLYGLCADMEGVIKIAAKYGLKVIEDTAQAFGAEYLSADRQDRGRKAGTIGDCGSISFFPGKNLGAFGDAGMVITNSERVAKNLQILRNQGNETKYYHLTVGFNHRLDTLQAAVLKVKLKYLDSWNEARRKNAAYFNRHFKDLGAEVPFVPEYTTHIYHQYVLRLNGPSAGLIAYLQDKGIDARVYYPVALHLQKCFRDLKYKKGDFPESEKASRETVAIPVYPDLTQDQLDYIANSVKEFFRQ